MDDRYSSLRLYSFVIFCLFAILKFFKQIFLFLEHQWLELALAFCSIIGIRLQY